eukprot:5144138-Amphidinium_carterae.1
MSNRKVETSSFVETAREATYVLFSTSLLTIAGNARLHMYRPVGVASPEACFSCVHLSNPHRALPSARLGSKCAMSNSMDMSTAVQRANCCACTHVSTTTDPIWTALAA